METMTTSYTYLPDLAGLLPDFQPEGIISRTVYTDEQVKAVLFAFDAGQELSEHTASTPATIHILRGEARLTLGDDAHEAGEGAWAHMPARLPHSLLAKTPVIMLLLLFKSAEAANP
jgi:quercetin dioxygenase-like cupin family protein